MNSIYRIAILLFLTVTSCAHHTSPVSVQPWKMDAETERVFAIQSSADLVVDYEWIDRIRLSTPGRTAYSTATDETLAAAIATATSKKELAVVVIGKPVLFAYPEPKLRSKVDSIEAVVKAEGFTRVVFQLGLSDGRRIYRE